MAEADIVLGKDDTAPVLRATLRDPAGDPVNLTGASLLFRMRIIDHSAAERTGVPTIVDGPGGVIQYDWNALDTAVAGTFKARIEATLASGKIMSWPNDRNWILLITDDP